MPRVHLQGGVFAGREVSVRAGENILRMPLVSAEPINWNSPEEIAVPMTLEYVEYRRIVRMTEYGQITHHWVHSALIDALLRLRA